MNNRYDGTIYEDLSVDYLNNNGVKILCRNYHFHKMGEIDIIGEDNEYLIFVEVKHRHTELKGYSLEAVDIKKQKQISKVALGYMMEKRICEDRPVRFDVIAIDGNDITWIKDAFSFMS